MEGTCMKKIKIIGLDLDGTLLNDKKEITSRTKDVLTKAMAAGVIVLPATGRPLSGVPEELLELPGIRYALTANGARIVDTKENKILWEKLVPADISRRILKIMEDYDTLREICYEGKSFAEADNLRNIGKYITDKPMAEYVLRTRTAVPDLWDKVEKMQDRGMDKVQGVFAVHEEKQEAHARIMELGELSVSGAMGNNLEVNAPGINKGAGLLKLGELLGIEKEEIAAFGDGNNDLQMIEMAGFGVAMDNGLPEVKKIADYITDTNNEDGVAKVIERFVL